MGGRKRNIALFVDGPNMVRRSEFGFGLKEIYEAARKYGDVRIAETFLNKYADEKFIEYIMNSGFSLGDIGIEDVDVPLASRVTEVICSPKYDFIGTIALSTRDGDFASLLHKVKSYNKEAIVIGAEPNFSPALKGAADYVEVLKGKGNNLIGD